MKKESSKVTGKVLSYFYGIVWKEKPQYFAYMVVRILVKSLLPFLTIMIPKLILEELMGDKDIRVLILCVFFLAGGTYLLNILCHIAERQVFKLDDWFYRYFETKICYKSMTMDFEHTENPEVLNQAEKAANGMWFYSGGLRGLSDCFVLLVSAVLTLLGTIAIISTASPLLFVIALFAVVGSSLVVRQINKLDIVTFNKGPQINRGFGYIFMELVDPRYGKDIRLYGGQDILMKLGADNLKELYLVFKELHDGAQKWECVNAVILAIKNIGIYMYLGYLTWIRSITVGAFMMLVAAANTFKDSLESIITQLQQLHKKAGFMNEYRLFMEYEDALVHGERQVEGAAEYCIEFKNVSFCYPRSNVYVLKNVNIKIANGEHLSVVGLNGAGKTTFIKLLCRMYDVTEGEILLNGVNIKEYDYKEYMKLLSVVFQDFKLFAMSFEDNIRMGDWEKERTELTELLELSGLKEKVDSLPQGLDTSIYKAFDKSGIEPSGGEQQKMAIARALYKSAPIVILDEPTAALDPLAEHEIYQQFDRLVGGKTAVYISHRLSSCKFCDRIAVFAHNTIKEYGTHEELAAMPDGIYAQMYQAQAQYYV